jgi:hypothetical protein
MIDTPVPPAPVGPNRPTAGCGSGSARIAGGVLRVIDGTPPVGGFAGVEALAEN